jgi:hypothetical protein
MTLLSRLLIYHFNVFSFPLVEIHSTANTSGGLRTAPLYTANQVRVISIYAIPQSISYKMLSESDM